MGKISQREDDWQAKATAAAIAEARKAVEGDSALRNTTAGKISDKQWGWIIAGALFGWITKRCEQAIAEGISHEEAVRMLELEPSPGEVAVARSILPDLVQAKIDWSQPLAAWSKETMTDFVLVAWKLMNNAEAALDAGPGIVQPSTIGGDQGDLPFG
jgi:hypothetical protein